jgi:response regulator NasT
MNFPSLRIVVAGDGPDVRNYLAQTLPDLGHQLVGCASTGSQLVELCRQESPDLVITDLQMAEDDGLAEANLLGAESFTPIIVITSCHDPTTLERAVAAQAFAYLVHPVQRVQLESAVVLAWQRFRQFQSIRQQADTLRQALEGRKLIERAKGILMRRGNLDEEQAFRRLQRLARDEQVKMTEIARMIVMAERALRAPVGRE